MSTSPIASAEPQIDAAVQPAAPPDPPITEHKPRRRAGKDAPAQAEPADLGSNAVALVGRLAAPAEARDLPSGDTVLVWRLIVPRPKPRATGTALDTIDCVSFDARIIKRGTAWTEGSWLQADGALRRRFWRSPGGPRSRYEVEVSAARVVAKPSVGRPSARS